MRWICTIDVPDNITQEQLQGEITETLAAGFDLVPEQYAVTVVEAPVAVDAPGEAREEEEAA